MATLTEAELNKLSTAEIRELAEAQEREAAEPQEETVYTRTVAGQTFSASSLEELTDLISAATEELVKAQAAPAPAVKELTAQELADREFVRGQELQTSPTETFRKMLLETTGLSPEEFKAQVKLTQAHENNTAAELFVQQHPEYLANKHNGATLESTMKKLGFDGKTLRVSDIEKAYEVAKDAGLLQERPPVVDPYAIDLETLKKIANNTPSVADDAAGSAWEF